MGLNNPQGNGTLNLLVNLLVMASYNLVIIIVCSLYPNMIFFFYILLVYVDDVLITGNSEVEIDKVKRFLNQNFTIKDLGNTKYFLGLELARSEGNIFVNQSKYVIDMLHDAGMTSCRLDSIPFPKNHKLNDKDGELLEDPQVFRRIVGRLLYLGFTRTDLAYVAQQLSQFIQKPKTSHWNVVIHVLYIKGTHSLGVFSLLLIL